MENLIGQTLNRYRITALLGEGGMGAVFRAQDTALQRDVALKVMHPHFARRPDFQERFLQEARSAARLDHPGIVQVHDFGSDRGLLYIVMKFIPGDNLEKMLRQMIAGQEWLLLGEAALLVRQVALALDYAHRQGVLHRDLKPANLMLEPEPSDNLPYRPVITDLGLARLADGGVTTQDGSSMGTPAYMSPEQTQGRPTDARSDVYSLGILLFELCTGRVPFRARTLAEAIQYHVHTPLPDPLSLRPEISQPLAQVIQTALEKDPARRYQSAAQLAEALLAAWPSVVSVFSAPSPLVKAISLLTCYQQSLVSPRGKSLFAAFDPAHPPANGVAPAAAVRGIETAAASGHFIQVLNRDQQTRTIPFKPPAMLAGRDPDCDIVLDDRKASRQHARIELAPDGQRFIITDLNSTNGSFLNSRRLPGGQPEAWAPDQALRIGDSWLRLLPAGSIAGVTAAATGAAVAAAAGPTRLADPAAMQSLRPRLSIAVESVQYSIEPGKTVSIPVTISNQGQVPDRFSLSVTGLPPGWATLSSRPLQMNPGDRQQAVVAIAPPRQPQSRAGRYPFSIRLASASQPNAENAEARLVLEVTPFSRFTAELIPPVVPDSQIGRVRLHNQGNQPDNYALSWQDPAGALQFTPPGLQTNLEPGQETLVEYRPSLRSKRFVGGAQSHPYSVQVSPAAGQSQTINASMVSRGAIPGWLLPVTAVLLLLLCAGLVAVFGGAALAENQATRSAAALQTQAAEAIQSTSGALTATVLAMENANQATIQAVTATAGWLAADDDKDGLNNGQEQQLNTLPNKRDTDEDGLDDGVEVNQYKTDPLKPDTDGDGLKDGDEVSRGLNPKNPDSDADGLPDAVDPAPLVPSTSTPDFAATQNAIQQTAMAQTAIAGGATASAAAAAIQTATSYALQTAVAQTAAAAQQTQAVVATQTAAAYWATQTALAVQTWAFPIDLSSARTVYYLRLSGPGQIRVRANWTGTQTDLALIINGPGQPSYYARQDGPTGLEVTYTVTPADFAAGNTWRVSVASFGAGQAEGSVEINYPSGAPVPLVDNFSVSPNSARGIAVLVLRGPGAIKAQANWSGIPASLALIVNGPGQVNSYARQDGGSPLQVTYNVTPADLAAGNIWRVSFVSFSDTNLNGTINLTYP